MSEKINLEFGPEYVAYYVDIVERQEAAIAELEADRDEALALLPRLTSDC